MRSTISIALLVLLPLISKTTFSQSQSEKPFRRYSPESWRHINTFEPDIRAIEQTINSSGFYFTLWTERNEPQHGYPYHSGVIKGVSDTASYRFGFYNRTGNNFSLASQLPETWCYPVFYEPSVDPSKSLPIGDTSLYEWRFERWNGAGRKVPAPVSIQNKEALYTVMVFSYWGLPEGAWSILGKKSVYAPTTLDTWPITSGGVVWITEPKELADTLNAYAACFWRAMGRENYTAAATWVNNILTRNPSSIVGYRLKADRAYECDSAAVFAALDSVIAIGQRWGDPVMPGATTENDIWAAWRMDMINFAVYEKWYWAQNHKQPNW